MNLSTIVIGAVLFIVVCAESPPFAYEDTYSNCLPHSKGRKGCPLFKHGSNKNTKNVFRTIDGTCNNLKRSSLGATHSKLRRMIPAQYADGVDLPRGHPASPDYYHIPTAHEVSHAVFASKSDQFKNDKKLSALFMTFGQFLDHDVSISPHEKCNVTDCSKNKAQRYPCMPIKFDRKKEDCFGFARSKPACKKSNDNTPRDQLNELTSFVDLSQVYGTTNEKARRLRRMDGSGKMKMTNKGLLPVDHAASAKKDCINPAKCHLVGDERGEENIALFAMHTVWVRQHNKIAKGLKKLNKRWRGERIYQTARKINGALWQHIVYNEFLPHLIDLKQYSKYHRGRKFFRLTRYNKKVDPRITNVFSAAAFRFGHALVANSFSLTGMDFNKVGEPIKLQNAFFNSTYIYHPQGGIEPIMMGCVKNDSGQIGHNIASDLKEKLFIFPGSSLFNDLMSLNIQRGRDHGIPTYMNWRKMCGFAKGDGRNFDIDDLKYTPKAIRHAFKSVYKNVNDIDLFPALLTEHHFKDKIVGPTLNCIFSRQFEALRFGDRFFYTHRGSFKRNQLKAITKISMSKILCNTLDGMVSIQENAFKVFEAGKDPKRKMCGDIADIDLSAWKDRRSY